MGKNKEEIMVCDGQLQHIAFIMDGNGRWSKAKGLPREAGHTMGAKNLRTILSACKERNIPYVTVYAFSTENWKRPQHEVDAIMKLLSEYLDEAARDAKKNQMQIRCIGDLTPLSSDLQEKIYSLQEQTKNYENYHLNIALNYGGRQEIVHAVNELIQSGKTTITEEDISSHLYSYPAPSPDLIVRTSGETRTSNFLLWQSSYSEYAFTKTLWPDFTPDELDAIIKDFYNRQRRFGGI